MKKQWKSRDGITLVALVVTIIVLLILAGVTLNIVLDNDGIINKTKEGAEEYENAQRGEEELLGNLEDYIEYAGKMAVIPEGYVASQIPGETTVAEGQVIYEIPDGASVNWEEGTITINNNTTNLQETVNQYVWIPINDINDMVMCSSNTGESVCNLVYNEITNTLSCTNPDHSDTATELVGRLYVGSNESEDSSIYSYTMDFNKKDQTYDSSSYREPAIITGNGTEYDGVNSNLETAGMATGSTSEQFLAQLESDFTTMVTSVAKNGGFYISRYEVGTNGESKKGQIILTNSSSNGADYLGANMWYGLYNATRNLENHRQMIWGCLYDQLIKFIGDEAQIGHNNRSLTTNPTLSGQNELDKMKNVYDLEGNFREWTLEANSSSERAYRGSVYNSTNANKFYSASCRIFNLPTIGNSSYYSTRTVLYI